MSTTAIRGMAAGFALAVGGCGAAGAPGSPTTGGAATPAVDLTIDLDAAVPVALPTPERELQPASFTTPDGKRGWVVALPAGLAIATPAYADGLLFVGGGYGSHAFYAFDAATGETRWTLATDDDGPTAAVVEDGCVAFNTESCTIYVAEATTGRLLWKEWLGDPLMSQPAIWEGRVYIAYPGGQRGASKPGHHLLCAELRTGKHLWEADITADVLSAPVVDDAQLHFTCHDGTSFVLDARTGREIARHQDDGTSAPVIMDGRAIRTRRSVVAGRTMEGLMFGAADDHFGGAQVLKSAPAEYLERGKGGGVKLANGAALAMDEAVGFSGGAPAAGQLDKAAQHVGFDTVAGGWSYQGSRAAAWRGSVFNAQGRTLACSVNVQASPWTLSASGAGVTDETQVFAPPAVGGDTLFVCSAAGHLLSLAQKNGAVGFHYTIRQPTMFQPALAKGRMYVGTANGLLVCLETGNPEADGWYAWGGNARHNKTR